MTGFGRGEVESDGHRFRAEIRSVNHRYFNANARLPREYAHLESRLAALCSERIERGHVNFQVEVESTGSNAGAVPVLNREVLDRYLEIVDSLEGLPGVAGRVSAEALLGLSGVIEWNAGSTILADEAFFEGAGRALTAALDEIVASREEEGRALERDLRDRLRAIEGLRRRLLDLAPRREERERTRLRRKVEELLDEPDTALEGRVAQEIVLLADRIDVSEELTRMEAHLEHFEAELDGEPSVVGRKLTFLLQELGREANTVAAKANDPQMQQAAIEIKAELEKMREQAENVE